MLDTMTVVKALGWFCGAFLAYLLSKWAAEEIYHMGSSGHGDHHEQAYTIPVEGGDDHGGDAEEEVIDVAALMAAADPAKGERVWGKCKSCHKLEDGANGTGPHLYSVVGRQIGVIDGFGYSEILSGRDDAWTVDALFAFLENPKGWAPGTKMSFNGLAKPTDRANLIAYLEGIGG